MFSKTFTTLHHSAKILAVVVAMSFLSACGVSFQQAMLKDTVPDKEKAYVYGNFLLEGSSNYNIAFVLKKHLRGSTLVDQYLPLKHNNGLYAVEFEPGQYIFGKLVYLRQGNQVHKEVDLSKEVSEVELELKPGKAYYLGDYVGYTEYNLTTYNTYSIKWNMRDIRNKYDTTTEAIKQAYPKLDQVEFVNLMATFETKLFPTYAKKVDVAKKLADLVIEKKYDELRELALKEAENNVSGAFFVLGEMYEKGWGVDINPIEAANWYQKGVDNNHPASMYNLSLLLLGSKVKKIDGPEMQAIEKKNSWYSLVNRSADSDYLPAMIMKCNFLKQSGKLKAPLSVFNSQISMCEKSLEKLEKLPESAGRKKLISDIQELLSQHRK